MTLPTRAEFIRDQDAHHNAFGHSLAYDVTDTGVMHGPRADQGETTGWFLDPQREVEIPSLSSGAYPCAVFVDGARWGDRQYEPDSILADLAAARAAEPTARVLSVECVQ